MSNQRLGDIQALLLLLTRVRLHASKTIGEVDVFSLQDNYPNPIEPTETTTFTLYGLTGFDIQYWTGSAWATVPGGSVTGNNKVWKKVTFAPLTTSKIRVLINATVDNWSRMVELEAWTSSANINWLVTDHLGTPRMILDQTGSLANVKRHDYLPFGEELFAPSGGRTIGQGYSGGDGVQLTEDIRSTLETVGDYRTFRLFKVENVLVELTYLIPKLEIPLSIDPTPFVEEEHFDFLLYVHNVMTEPGRRNKVWNQ